MLNFILFFLPSQPNTSIAAGNLDNAIQIEDDSQIPLTQDPIIDSDILEILGKQVSSVTEYVPNIHDELSTWLQHIATSGLDKNTRKELIAKYLTPGNCTKIEAPLLNVEIKATLSEPALNEIKV